MRSPSAVIEMSLDGFAVSGRGWNVVDPNHVRNPVAGEDGQCRTGMRPDKPANFIALTEPYFR